MCGLEDTIGKRIFKRGVVPGGGRYFLPFPGGMAKTVLHVLSNAGCSSMPAFAEMRNKMFASGRQERCRWDAGFKKCLEEERSVKGLNTAGILITAAPSSQPKNVYNWFFNREFAKGFQPKAYIRLLDLTDEWKFAPEVQKCLPNPGEDKVHVVRNGFAGKLEELNPFDCIAFTRPLDSAMRQTVLWLTPHLLDGGLLAAYDQKQKEAKIFLKEGGILFALGCQSENAFEKIPLLE